MGNHNNKADQAAKAPSRPPLPYPVRDGRVAPSVLQAQARRERRKRGRIATISASAVAVGAAASMSFAFADPVDAAPSSEITFEGGCGALTLFGASSTPDNRVLSVEAGSYVAYTNDLATTATLHVGQEVYDIDAGSSHTFAMNASAEVAMVPDCKGLFPTYDSAEIIVIPAVVDEKNEDSAPTQTETETLPSDTNDSSNSDSTKDQSATNTEASTDENVNEDNAAADGEWASGDEWAEGGTGENASATEADTDAKKPGTAESDTTERENEADVLVSENDPDEDATAFGGLSADEDAAADQFGAENAEVALVDPDALRDGANGLLALLAIVCLAGVSVAVMRIVLRSRLGSTA